MEVYQNEQTSKETVIIVPHHGRAFLTRIFLNGLRSRTPVDVLPG